MNLRVVRILSDFSNMCGDEGRAMRWKNKKQKLQYIEKICEDNAQAIKQKLPVLLELSQDKNPEVTAKTGFGLSFPNGASTENSDTSLIDIFFSIAGRSASLIAVAPGSTS